ncbi:MAG: arsenate reductase [Calditrichaeota bacterium]|nr:arsenate reductase [Calditrichota bacterium]
MKYCFYLSSCSTCKRIMSEFDLSDFELQDIKAKPLTTNQLELMHKLSGSYESLFSRRSRKYAELKLAEKTLTEADYKRLILTEYTFLKRPVFIIGQQIFIGSDKRTITELAKVLN